MSLSLEVKKFINSESIGNSVTVTLPGELPADNAELRAISRERAAAQKAAKEAQWLSEDAAAKQADAADAEKAFNDAKKELSAFEKAFSEMQKKHDKLKAAQKEKRSALDKAKAALDKAKAEAEKCASAFPAAEEAFSAAEKLKLALETKLEKLKAPEDPEKADGDSDETPKEPSAEKQGDAPSVSEKTVETVKAKPEETAEAKAVETVEAKPEEAAEAKAVETVEVKPEEAVEAKPEETVEAVEAELEKAKQKHKESEAALADARKAQSSAAEKSKLAQMEFDRLSAELSDAEKLLEADNSELEGARNDKNALGEHVNALEKAHAQAQSELSEAQKASAAAAKEAERLSAAVRTLKTEHESASMHYLESGKGETLLLIHTAAQSLFTFRSIFYKLAMNYHVVAVDLMGHGCSDRPDFFDYSIASHAESLASFMDALGIERAHLFGFSMGAGYALELARLYPERVMSVIALSPGGVTSTMPLSVRMMESALFGGVASRLFRLKTVEKLLDECLFDHTVIGPHEVGEYYKCISDSESRRAIRLTVSSFGEKELLGSLSEVTPPVLVVSSEKDRWHTIEQSELYEKALRGCASATVRNAGHLPHEEKPDRVVEIVRSFIPAGYGDYDGRDLP